MKPVSAAAAAETAAELVGREQHIAPAPRVSVQAFCETVETAAAIQAAGEDRRLSKAHLRIQMGGLTAAIEAYQNSPTPNVIMLETESRSDDILGGLDQLAEICDAGTRVVVIGRMNDVTLYRELVRRGVSDYLISPVGTLQIVRSVCGLFWRPTPSRSAASSPWSGPRAASAPPPSRTTSRSPSPTTSSSMRS
jgi:pilus assembly protein CpaE